MASLGLLAKLRSPAVLAAQNGSSSLALPNYMADEVEESRASIAAVMCSQASIRRACRMSHASAAQALGVGDEEDGHSTPLEPEWQRGSRPRPSPTVSEPLRATSSSTQQPLADAPLSQSDPCRGQCYAVASAGNSPRTYTQPQHGSAPPPSTSPRRPSTSASDSAARPNTSSAEASVKGVGGPRRPLSATASTQAHLPAGQAGAGAAGDGDLLAAVTGRLAQQLDYGEGDLDEEELAADLQVARDTLERALQMARGGAGRAAAASEKGTGCSGGGSRMSGCSGVGSGPGAEEVGTAVSAPAFEVLGRGGSSDDLPMLSSQHSASAAWKGGRAGSGNACGCRRSSGSETRPMQLVEIEVMGAPSSSSPQLQGLRRGAGETGGSSRPHPYGSTGGILDRVNRTSSPGSASAPGPFFSAAANPVSFELWSLHSSSPINSRAASILSAASSATAAAVAPGAPSAHGGAYGGGSAPVTPSRRSPRVSSAAFAQVSIPDNGPAVRAVSEEVDLEAASPKGVGPGSTGSTDRSSRDGIRRFGAPPAASAPASDERDSSGASSLKLGGLLKLAKKAFRRAPENSAGSGGSTNTAARADAAVGELPSALVRPAAPLQVRPSVPAGASTPISPTQASSELQPRRGSAAVPQPPVPQAPAAPTTGMPYESSDRQVARTEPSEDTAAQEQPAAAVLRLTMSAASSISDIALDCPAMPGTSRGGSGAGGASSGTGAGDVGALARPYPFSHPAAGVMGGNSSPPHNGSPTPASIGTITPAQRRRHSMLASGHGAGAATDLQVTAHVQSFLHHRHQYVQQLQQQAEPSKSDGSRAERQLVQGGMSPPQAGQPGAASFEGGSSGRSGAAVVLHAARFSGPDNVWAAATAAGTAPTKPVLGWQPCSARQVHSPTAANLALRTSMPSGGSPAAATAAPAVDVVNLGQAPSSPVGRAAGRAWPALSEPDEQPATGPGSRRAEAPCAAAEPPGNRLIRSSSGGGGPAVVVRPRPPPMTLLPDSAAAQPGGRARAARRSAADGAHS